MTRQLKKTAHRPSQSNMQYVINSHGDKVLNTAYKPDNKEHDAHTDGIPDGDKDIDMGQYGMPDAYQVGTMYMTDTEIEDVAHNSIDMLNNVSDKVDQGEILSKEEIETLGNMQDYMRRDYMKNSFVALTDDNDNIDKVIDAWKEEGYFVSGSFYDKTTNHDNWMPEIVSSGIYIRSDDPDAPTEFLVEKEGLYRSASIKMEFGNKKTGVIKYEQRGTSRMITTREEDGNTITTTTSGAYREKTIEYGASSDKEKEYWNNDMNRGKVYPGSYKTHHSITYKDGSEEIFKGSGKGDYIKWEKSANDSDYTVTEQKIPSEAGRRFTWLRLNDAQHFSYDPKKVKVSYADQSSYEAGNDVTYGYHDDGTMKGTWVDKDGRHHTITYDIVKNDTPPKLQKKSLYSDVMEVIDGQPQYSLVPVSATVDGKEDTTFANMKKQQEKEQQESYNKAHQQAQNNMVNMVKINGVPVKGRHEKITDKYGKEATVFTYRNPGDRYDRRIYLSKAKDPEAAKRNNAKKGYESFPMNVPADVVSTSEDRTGLGIAKYNYALVTPDDAYDKAFERFAQGE